jgi:pilus assembly protein FimV
MGRPDAAVSAAEEPMIDLPIDEDGDPLARKLELAEEFRQIGDVEGARDLLEEVIAKADGVIKSKAQAMLEGLA